MALIKVADALVKSQTKAVNALNAVRANRIADAYMKVADESCSNLYDRGVCATLINNFAKIVDSAPASSKIGPTAGETTTMGDFGPYVMEVWPLVTAWYPDFPLKDLISVQDMDKPLAYMFFSKLKTGTAKGTSTVGDVVETALGRRTLKGQYPTGEIFGEVIPAAQFDATGNSLLAYAPLNVETIPGYDKKVKIVIGPVASSTDVSDYNKNKIVGDTIELYKADDTKLATIEISTGIITLATATAPSADVTVNYVWNLDFGNVENLQKVKEEIEMVPMEATPRALMLEWTLFAEFLKKSQFGKDIREDNTKRILNLIYQFQVRYILDEMFTYATGAATGVSNNITITTTGTYAADVVNMNAQRSFKTIASAIELASGRMEGNRIVCGLTLKNWLEALPNTFFKPATIDAKAFLGPREIGEWGTFKVYYDPEMAADNYMMTYRGSEFYDAAYYLGEYMPVVPTDAIALGVTVRSSFVSMEAYKYHKPNCVFKGTITIA